MRDDATGRESVPGGEVNPFATKYTRLGAVEPLEEDGRTFDPAAVLARLESAGGCGVFVGPHGSGKSTRLEACARAAEDTPRAGLSRAVRRVRLRRRWDLWGTLRAVLGMPAGGLICVDSLEQAGRVGTFCLTRLARLRGVELLATCHTPCGLPVMAMCHTSLELLKRVVEQLPPHAGLVSQQDLADAFSAANGNIRDALFELYDRAETARSRQRS